MSHISRIKTGIIEKEHLLQALKDLGYEYEEGDLTIGGFGGQQTAVEIRVPLRLSSDIGFRKTGSGYEIVADWWGVRGITGPTFTQQVTQRYAYHVTRTKLEAQGFTLVEEAQEKGQIRLVLRRAA